MSDELTKEDVLLLAGKTAQLVGKLESLKQPNDIFAFLKGESGNRLIRQLLALQVVDEDELVHPDIRRITHQTLKAYGNLFPHSSVGEVARGKGIAPPFASEVPDIIQGLKQRDPNWKELVKMGLQEAHAGDDGTPLGATRRVISNEPGAENFVLHFNR